MGKNIYMTSEQLARRSFPDKRTELVRGRLVVREPAKLRHGIAAGTLLVLLIDPRRRCGTVYRADGSVTDVTELGAFDGESVLPGFFVTLASVLAVGPRAA